MGAFCSIKARFCWEGHCDRMFEVAGFLHLQPGKNFFRQRLIPEAEKFEVLEDFYSA